MSQRQPSGPAVEELAIFSGRPTFTGPLYVGRPNIGDREAFFARVEDIFDRRWLTNHGRHVVELEERIAEQLGVRHFIATCNGTVALEIAAHASGLQGEVIVPSFTFVATAHALRWLGMTPVFCDITPERHTIDPARVEELITPNTSGILAVHVWGRPCAVEELDEIARRHNLHLLFDAAHAFACTHHGRYIGNFGEAEIFSFHATKFFNTFEGGGIATNDDDLAHRARSMRDFGFDAPDTTESMGTNGKMSEVHAAMGLTNLDALDTVVSVNERNHDRYEVGLSGIDGLVFNRYDHGEIRNSQYVVIEIEESRFGMSRDRLLEILRAENVLARRYFYPACHQLEPYASSMPEVGARLPHTERLASQVLTLPTGTAVGDAEIEVVCGLIRTAHDHASEIAERLGVQTMAG